MGSLLVCVRNVFSQTTLQSSRGEQESSKVYGEVLVREVCKSAHDGDGYGDLLQFHLYDGTNLVYCQVSHIGIRFSKHVESAYLAVL